MLAIFFGTYDATAHPRVAVLRDGLREHGVTVLECNAPLGLRTADRVAMLRQPWRLPLLALRLADRWARLVVRARRLPRPDVVVVGYLGHFDVRLARALYPRGSRRPWARSGPARPHGPATTIVLDHLIGASDTARDRGVEGGLRQRLLRALDAQALRAADLVLVDTQEHAVVLAEPKPDRDVLVVPVGAPVAWLAAGRRAAAARGTARAGTASGGTASGGTASGGTGPLRVVFFGLYTPLQGAPVIGCALAALAALAARTGRPVHTTMIGSGQDLTETRRLASGNDQVTWLDWVGPGDLPDLVAAHDVCLGIFGTGAKALRVVPNKVFQGAAAGCALVTSDTPPQRRLLGDAAVLVPLGDADALAAALADLAADRGRLQRLRAGSIDLAHRRFTPAQVTAALSERLHAVVQENA